jgi:hypothetical protein
VAKREWTLRERGLDFANAGALFEGPVFSFEDKRRDYGEVRWISYGLRSRVDGGNVRRRGICDRRQGDPARAGGARPDGVIWNDPGKAKKRAAR